jgi:hypothetical protein
VKWFNSQIYNFIFRGGTILDIEFKISIIEKAISSITKGKVQPYTRQIHANGR